MSYLIFARKFRPQTFEDVVGQEPIVKTLQNAITNERIPQNFLFSGPRGVGKTSIARITAMALNCENGPKIDFDPKSEGCREIAEGRSMDVLEIDGASNRGIDEIRNLRETVKFKPVNGRYKIYIIDEVHMLTTEAFNALLKTLEEPPEHVKFIFATTESHKVPLTILSRCQRYNFKRIPTASIAEKLEDIAKREKLKFDKNAIFQIAKASDGALRDGETLLDQLASFSDGKIKEEDVLLALGLASEELYFKVLGYIADKDAQKIFELVEELYDSGKDLVQFAKGLLEVFRHLLLFQCTPEGDKFVDMSDDGIAQLKQRKDSFSRGELLFALSLLGNLQNQLRRNLASPRLLVETALLKLLHLDGLQSLNGLIQSGSGASQPYGGRPAPSRVPARPAAPTSSRPQAPARPQSQQIAAPPSAQSSAASKASAPAQASAPVQQPAPAVSGGNAGLGDVDANWSRIIEYVKTKRMSVGIFLSEAAPVEMKGGLVTLGLSQEFGFHRDMLEKDINMRTVEEGFEVVLGQKIKVQYVITEIERIPAPESAPAPAAAETSSALGAASDDAENMPDIISEAMNIFEGAKIVKKD